MNSSENVKLRPNASPNLGVNKKRMISFSAASALAVDKKRHGER